MASDLDDDRAAVAVLLSAGDIRGAVATLRTLADKSGDPEDRLFVGRLAFVATDYKEAQKQLEQAYRDFQGSGAPRRAALAAAALAVVYHDGMGELVVGQGWRARALSLLESEEPCVEQGYALLAPTGATIASAEELEANANTALVLARRFGDSNLECKALADLGLALVSMGHLREGVARLDESFAMIIGGDCKDPGMISQAVCSMLSACERSGDVTRAETWVRFVEERASGNQTAAIHTFSHCFSAFGSTLCEVGRWTEAETALRAALSRGELSFHANKDQARAALADLWTRQGRLSEAERLMEHTADRIETMGPRARLLLAQRRYDLAAVVARNALRQLSGDRLRASTLLLTVVDAELGLGNVDAAEEAAQQMVRLAEDAEPRVLIAQARLALGRIAAAKGDAAVAASDLEEGLSELPGDNWPLVRAAMLLERARALKEKDPPQAIVDAEAALSITHRLGAPEAFTAAGLLRELGVTTTAELEGLSPLDPLSKREREVLALLADGLSNPEIATQLFISAKTAEHHVSSILRKLGLRNRAEAAAFAASFRISEDGRLPVSPGRSGRK